MSFRPTRKKNILIVTGTRAEYGLLKPVMRALLKSKKFSPKFLVTGMHTLKKFGLTLNEIKKDRMPIAAVVPVSEKDDMPEVLAKEIKGISDYCEKNKVDLIFVLGDIAPALAGAIVGTHLKIPVAHINGGDVSGAGPDEFIRHAITKFSHIHFTSCAPNAKRVLALGEERWRVFNVGATGLDGLSKIKYSSKKELAKKFNLDPNKKWFFVVYHPAPLDKTPFFKQIKPLLETLAGYDTEKLVSYPNADTGSEIFIREIEKYKNRNQFHVFKTLPRPQYLSFLRHADLLVGNSSSGFIESAHFKIPVVNIGTRQLGRPGGTNVIHADYTEKEIRSSIDKALTPLFRAKARRGRSPYNSGNASAKITKILEKHFNLIGTDELFFKPPPQ